MIVTPSNEGTACISLESTILATPAAPHITPVADIESTYAASQDVIRLREIAGLKIIVEA